MTIELVMVDVRPVLEVAQWVLLVVMAYSMAGYVAVSEADRFGRYLYLPAGYTAGMLSAIFGAFPMPAVMRVAVEVIVISLALWGIRSEFARGLSEKERDWAKDAMSTLIFAPLMTLAFLALLVFGGWLTQQPGWWN